MLAVSDFNGGLAVITGAGSGIGRALALALAARGCHLALLDIAKDRAEATAAAVREHGVLVTAHGCDVTDESELVAARTRIEAEHHIDDRTVLVFNNAGIGTNSSFATGDRGAWERTFEVCWNGVYLGSRVLLPLLLRSRRGHLVNVSSINGLWASLGPDRNHSAYSTAKFAVRGFTEGLITEFRRHAPHVRPAVVMPGHIQTDILTNSTQVLGTDVGEKLDALAQYFKATAPTTADEAAAVILDELAAGRWRILVGADAHILDEQLRQSPDTAYEPDFVERLHGLGAMTGLIP